MHKAFKIHPLICLLMTCGLEAHGTHSQLMGIVNEKLGMAPTDANLWYQRAILNLEHEDAAQAIADLETAERLSPGKLPTLLLKGKSLVLLGNLPEARSALDAYITRFPNDASGYVWRGRVLLKLGMREAALADYRTALAISPDAEPDLLDEAASAMAACAYDDEAIGVLDHGLKRLGEIPSLQSKVIEIEMAAGQHDSAFARVDEIIKSTRQPEMWMAKRASLLAQAGRPDESHAAWQLLADHLRRLPDPVQTSHSMQILSAQAQQALSATKLGPPSNPFFYKP